MFFSPHSTKLWTSFRQFTCGYTHKYVEAGRMEVTFEVIYWLCV